MDNKQRPKADGGSLMRVIGKFFRYYPVLAPTAVICILFAALVSSIPPLFIRNVIEIIEKWYEGGDWASARAELLPYILLLAGLYVLSIIAVTVQTQLMAYMTQGFLDIVNSLTVKDVQQFANDLIKQGNKATLILTAEE